MDFVPELPIPISKVGGRYLLFSIDAVTYLRREHHICGVLMGTIPQVPQQNVFLGLPLALMPEEACLLAEKGVAFIIDDALAHQDGVSNLPSAKKVQYQKRLKEIGDQAALAQQRSKEQARSKALGRAKSKTAKKKKGDINTESNADLSEIPDETSDETLFTPQNPEPAPSEPTPRPNFGVTPATSLYLLDPSPTREFTTPKTNPLTIPSSYPLFRHLHTQGFFISPGLRFGCQYLVYPGDPLRFHSHFLASSVGWDEEFDLMDLVAGGRLGTGVKKAYLIGGGDKGVGEGDEGEREKVRTFSIEWAGM